MAKAASNIDTLSYSPAVYVYVAHKTKSGWRYYDVSDDVTRCSVTRNVGRESSFSVSLLNPDGKYNGAFDPMDPVTVFARKSGKKKVRLITGYATTVSKYSLFPGDFSMSGKCSLYRLQKLYWDPSLQSSYDLLAPIGNSRDERWGGFEKIVYALLTEVGSVDRRDVRIGGIPDAVVGWARSMFDAKQRDIAQSEQMLDDFYGILQSTGMTLQTAGGEGDGDGRSDGDISGSGGTASVEAVENAVKWMIDIADNHNEVGYSMTTRYLNPNVDCSSFVYYALYYNGWKGGYGFKSRVGAFSTGSMTGILTRNGWSKHVWNHSASSLKRGDILWVDVPGGHHHTEMYIGGGKTVGAHSATYTQARQVSVVGTSSVFTHYFRYKGM